MKNISLLIFLCASLFAEAKFPAVGNVPRFNVIKNNVLVSVKNRGSRDDAFKNKLQHVTDEDTIISSSLVSGKSTGNILYSEDFESATINKSIWMKEAIDTAYSVATSKDFARKNGRCAKFSFDFSEWTNIDSLQPDGHRTEIHPRKGTVPGRFDLNKDYWIGFSNFFPSTWRLDPTTTIVWQFHGYGSPDSLAGGSNQPPLYGSINANKDFINIQVIDSTGTMFSIGRVPIVKNQWNDWVMHVKFGYKSGFDTIWVNGTRVAAYSGSNFYHVPGQITNFGPYFKMGIYKPSWGDSGIVGQASNLTMYDDAFVIGNSKATYDQISTFFGSTSKPSKVQKFNMSTSFSMNNAMISSNDALTSTNNALASSFNTSKIIAYPNPANNNITVQFNAISTGNYMIEVTDISGKTLQTKRLNAISGLNRIMLDVSSYVQGMYMINVVDDKNKKQLLKFNKLP